MFCKWERVEKCHNEIERVAQCNIFFNWVSVVWKKIAEFWMEKMRGNEKKIGMNVILYRDRVLLLEGIILHIYDESN